MKALRKPRRSRSRRVGVLAERDGQGLLDNRPRGRIRILGEDGPLRVHRAGVHCVRVVSAAPYREFQICKSFRDVRGVDWDGRAHIAILSQIDDE